MWNFPPSDPHLLPAAQVSWILKALPSYPAPMCCLTTMQSPHTRIYTLLPLPSRLRCLPWSCKNLLTKLLNCIWWLCTYYWWVEAQINCSQIKETISALIVGVLEDKSVASTIAFSNLGLFNTPGAANSFAPISFQLFLFWISETASFAHIKCILAFYSVFEDFLQKWSILTVNPAASCLN